MKLLAVLLGLPCIGFSQIDTAKYVQESEEFRIGQDAFYHSKETSPLTKKERQEFHGHNFWDISMDYVVEAAFERITTVDTVVMGTSAGTKKMYQPYAKLLFNINEEACELIVYQSLKLRELEEYKDYLFIPFRDATSGNESYGGGRYLDITIPDTDKIIINFNVAYNPYCAYTDGYYCTIPPVENTLKIPIRAGLKAPDGH